MVTALKITIKTEQSIQYVQACQHQPTEIPAFNGLDGALFLDAHSDQQCVCKAVRTRKEVELLGDLRFNLFCKPVVQ